MANSDQMSETLIRIATHVDFDAHGDLMFQAIRTAPSPFSEAQREGWHTKLATQHVILAERPQGITGFMSLRPVGYFDLVFILPQAREVGLFRTPYREIETHAARTGLGRIWAHASLMALPAFSAVGFDAVPHVVGAPAAELLSRGEIKNKSKALPPQACSAATL